MALLAGATAVAWIARDFGGYPSIPCDEINWSRIAAYVESGLDWPISGPLHFLVSSRVAAIFDLTHAQALAVLGIISVPVALLVMIAGYRLLGFGPSGGIVLVLATSTYFWAPLLESRPQQWGQALVLLGTAVSWRGFTVSERWWLMWAAVALLTAWVHILSAAIGFSMTLLVGLTLLCLRRTGLRQFVAMGLACVPAAGLFAWPSGPYAPMLYDLMQNHLLVSHATYLGVLATLAAAITGVILAGARGYLQPVVERLLGMLAQLPRGRSWIPAVVVLPLLAVQAAMLPAEAWLPYHDSVWLFFLLQAGNLVFLVLLLRGLAREGPKDPGQPSSEDRKLQVLLLCISLLALGGLAASAVMLDTNWMLRIINYGLPMIAPLAARGLSLYRKTMARGAVVIAACAISGIAAVRPPLLFG